MQITEFSVKGLFGQFDHEIPFSVDHDSKNRASVTIFHGLNGVGKSTLLRMLNGMMQLDFTEFRRVPFISASLTFNSGENLVVTPKLDGNENYLEINFDSKTAHLDYEESGPFKEKYEGEVVDFREHFKHKTSAIHFELIETTRLINFQRLEDEKLKTTDRLEFHSSRKKNVSHEMHLAKLVFHFINEAQANYRRFFSAEGPDPWKMILQKLTQDTMVETLTNDQLRSRLDNLAMKQKRIGDSGLGDSEWGFTWMQQYLQNPSTNDDRSIPLTVLTTYIELLDSKINQQLLLAERLITFEELLSSFFSHKRVIVSNEEGFLIETTSGQKLDEHQLSSGEYHLLYLMVRSLIARRRGTVIAIDEPELSMHISWQRKLVKALCDCAAGAEPQFLLATHSPDIARDFKDSMIRLGED